ncbi:MAG: chorismate synthase [Candidatus Omnitrophica bacterium]|nr:chorismate synthase [Candidatus Omnitrophota bacterium]MCM8809986.1 chorismate synthase [Candidatus Omnitrophota bacterium]MCM8810447.1 chorismate synthase [Candidatus Omnitrophota bacterium]
MLRFLTGGESHGKCLIGILEGMVANLPLDVEDINKELERRQKGYGRGRRMEIEKDKVDILSGVRDGKTTGSPISLLIENKDWENWKEYMDIKKKKEGKERYIPRPGHADLWGYLKFNYKDIRDVIERASARETAIRVAIGAICKKFLSQFNVKIYSRVKKIGKVEDEGNIDDIKKNYEIIENSPVRCLKKEKEMMKEIDRTREKEDTVGGIFEVIVEGVCPGLGSYVHWDKRLDAKISYILMSIPGIKGIEFGLGFEGVSLYGSDFHDEIFYKDKIVRKTNNLGGIEGGITNGNDIWIKCFMKPVPTIKKSLSSIDIRDFQEKKYEYERSDVCAVVPAGIIAENLLAFVLASEYIEKFGGDCLEDLKNNYTSYIKRIKNFWY